MLIFKFKRFNENAHFNQTITQLRCNPLYNKNFSHSKHLKRFFFGFVRMLLLVCVHSSVFACVYLKIFPRVPFFAPEILLYPYNNLYLYYRDCKQIYTQTFAKSFKSYRTVSLNCFNSSAHNGIHANTSKHTRTALTPKSENNAQMKRNLSYGIKLCRKSLYWDIIFSH